MKSNLKMLFWLLSLLLVASAVAAQCGAAPSQSSANTSSGGQVEPTKAVEPTQAAAAAPTATTAPTETAAPTAEVKMTEEAAKAPTEEMKTTEEATTEATAEAAMAGTESQVALPEVNPLEVKGDIIAAGSSTVYPLSERMAERFKDEGYSGNITIDSIGSGAGFERFCKAGETDISNASRKIKDEEVANCQKIGRTPLEFRVGTDALAIVVSKDNDFLKAVTKAQLAQIFSTAQKWSDVDPSWPAEPIQRFSPGTDSGTFDYFVEVVMDPAYVKDATADKGKGKEAILNAKGIQLSEDDNVLAQGVEGSKYAIGYFGYAYYQNQKDKLNILSVEGVEPSFETAESGKYPLARPLFMYSDAKILQEKPQVAAFINFYLSYVDEEIEGVGYFPASRAAIDQAKQAWLDATK